MVLEAFPLEEASLVLLHHRLLFFRSVELLGRDLLSPITRTWRHKVFCTTTHLLQNCTLRTTSVPDPLVFGPPVLDPDP
jgi:hypothetical protein